MGLTGEGLASLSIGGAAGLFKVLEGVKRRVRRPDPAVRREQEMIDRVAVVFSQASGFLFTFFLPRRIKTFFLFEELLGQGGFGSVHLVKPTAVGVQRMPMLHRGGRYAIKGGSLRRLEPFEYSMTLLSDERLVEWQGLMLSQAADDRCIAHMHVILIEPAMGRYYEVMEYLQGPDLYTYLCARVNAVPDRTAGRLLTQLLSALQYLHAEVGMVHRDVKPENLAFAWPIERGRALPPLKLFDFGLSWILPSKPESEADVRSVIKLPRAGTPVYMGPETWDGLCGPPSDIWSAGTVAYIMFNLALPFGLEKFEAGEEIKAAQLGQLHWCDSEPSLSAQRLVNQALMVAPGERSTAQELLDLARRMASGGADAGDARSGDLPTADSWRGPIGSGTSFSISRQRAQGKESMAEADESEFEQL
uniref:non-specific serine/threonine protein kinase n=1 Tax=Zooxanthella nutricula TaxID=1333877 RepID=A0A6U6J4D3_9DINO